MVQRNKALHVQCTLLKQIPRKAETPHIIFVVKTRLQKDEMNRTHVGADEGNNLSI